jgi:hypothetical protein
VTEVANATVFTLSGNSICAHVTETQNPVAPTSHVVTPRCTDATMTVQVDNPLSGITYTLSQTGHQPVSVKANGSPVIFTGLQFGIWL